MDSCRRPLAAIAAAIAILAPPPTTTSAAQQPTGRLTPELYLEWEEVRPFLLAGGMGPQISPDGGQVLYERRHIDKMRDRWVSELHLANADGTRNRRLTDGGRSGVVSQRRPHRIRPRHGRRRRPNLRALDGRRGGGHPDQPSYRVARRPDLVARRRAPRLLDDGALRAGVDGRDPRTPRRRRLDRRAEGRHSARLPARLRGLHRRRISAHLRPPRVGRHPTPADRRRLEPRRACVVRRRHRDPLHQPARTRPRPPLPRVRDLRGVGGLGRDPPAHHPRRIRPLPRAVAGRPPDRLPGPRRDRRRLLRRQHPRHERRRERDARDRHRPRPRPLRPPLGRRRQRRLLQRARRRRREPVLRAIGWPRPPDHPGRALPHRLLDGGERHGGRGALQRPRNPATLSSSTWRTATRSTPSPT